MTNQPEHDPAQRVRDIGNLCNSLIDNHRRQRRGWLIWTIVLMALTFLWGLLLCR